MTGRAGHAVEIRRRHADHDHDVVTVESPAGVSAYRREPCPHCPWRRDQPTGRFPAEAFRHSAETAHDMSTHMFGCHMSGPNKPQHCAGFLLRGAAHNLAVRLDLMKGKITPDEVHSPVPLYDSYREMAEANGVPPDDPALAPCRD
ncbi:DUF6283 family protein (plasmid) [Azospirillum sp. HJ39]|uniref:DUF6283 family protein n=1 Tax=Azospirillum sp. HJ39 TaxID=3159496 RepID=UPI0035588723